MPHPTADVVICGAGIAGIATAYHLSVNHGLKNVVLVDERPPMSLTSDKSTECYRNWWPGPGDAMVSLMNRSIDLLEELARQCDNCFNLNRRGYLYATADQNRIKDFKQVAEEAASLGAGPVRYYTGRADDPTYQPAPAHGFEDQPTGTDIMLDPDLIRKQFPYLVDDVVAVAHTRRCGWFSGQQLGMFMLEQAQAHGVKLVWGRVKSVDMTKGRVKAVRVGQHGPDEIVSTANFVNAAGPFLAQVGQMVGVELPLFSELHLKWSFNDHLKIVPRQAPMIIWADPMKLNWSAEEQEFLAESQDTRWLLDEFPAGVHTRPEGHGDSPWILLLWAYHLEPVETMVPPPLDPDFPEVVLRGITRMLPSLSVYLDRMPKPNIDGGYYTKTRENRPLICPLPVQGAYVIGALSGFGLMAAPAAGELLAAHITDGQLPAYASTFDLSRYKDPGYQRLLENWGDTGQL
jgi:glycine/D-amino acid oxidase-like deaminating enzyme